MNDLSIDEKISELLDGMACKIVDPQELLICYGGHIATTKMWALDILSRYDETLQKFYKIFEERGCPCCHMNERILLAKGTFALLKFFTGEITSFDKNEIAAGNFIYKSDFDYYGPYRSKIPLHAWGRHLYKFLD